MELNRSDVIEAVLRGDANIGIIVRSSGDTKSFSGLVDRRNLEGYVADTSEVFVSMGPLSPFHSRISVTFEEIEGCFHIALDMEREAVRDLHINYTSLLDENKIAFFNTISACKEFLSRTPALLYTPKWVSGFFAGTEIHTARVMNSGSPNELIWFKRRNEKLNDTERQFINSFYKLFSTPCPI